MNHYWICIPTNVKLEGNVMNSVIVGDCTVVELWPMVIRYCKRRGLSCEECVWHTEGSIYIYTFYFCYHSFWSESFQCKGRTCFPMSHHISHNTIYRAFRWTIYKQGVMNDTCRHHISHITIYRALIWKNDMNTPCPHIANIVPFMISY